ncbi:hypothetical protein D9M71_830800 [compost metagenome]
MDDFIGATRVRSPIAIELFGNPSAGLIPDDTPIRLSANRLHSLARDCVIANGTRLNLDDVGKRLMRCVCGSPGIRLAELLARLPDQDANKLRALIHQLCHQDILELVRY